jgi:hypothetical protein
VRIREIERNERDVEDSEKDDQTSRKSPIQIIFSSILVK